VSEVAGIGPQIGTPIGRAPIIPLLLIGFGAYFLWWSSHFWRDENVKWPSDPIKSALQGKGIPAHVEAASTKDLLAADISTASSEAQASAALAEAITAGAHSGAQPWTHGQLANLWRMAGGSQGTANNAACHAIQESSGESGATSANPDGGTNVGLWQLDTKGVGAGHSIDELKDPMTNAKLTVAATKNGADWSQWATPGC